MSTISSSLQLTKCPVEFMYGVAYCGHVLDRRILASSNEHARTNTKRSSVDCIPDLWPSTQIATSARTQNQDSFGVGRDSARNPTTPTTWTVLTPPNCAMAAILRAGAETSKELGMSDLCRISPSGLPTTV